MINRTLFRKEMREQRWKLAGGLIYFGILAVAMVILYDLTVSMLSGLKIPAPYTADLQAMFKEYPFYLWGNWFGKNLFQSGLVFSIIVGMGLISSEVSHDTMGFLLARPVRREEVFATKYFTGAVVLAATILLTTLLVYYTSIGIGKDLANLSLGKLMLGALMNFIGFVTVFSLAAYFSVLFNETIKAGAAAAVVCIIAGLPGWFPPTAKWSLFHYMQGFEIFTGKGFPWAAFLLLAAISTGMYCLGMKRFCRRDF
ncbi:MAG: ABC transporter permease [Bacillota bacterium]